MNTKDCTQGFCSLSCPQWCLIFPPPPPPPPSSSLLDDYHKSRSGSNFSPLVIAIIGILASAFLLVSYYAIASKYCGNSRVDNNNDNHPPNEEDMEEDDHNLDPSHHEPWLINTNGLDEALINNITLVKFKKGDALFGTSLCSICLGEFLEDHTLRLLPKCSHAFHVACIDTWLKSHSNCPLCRANILSTFAHPYPSSPPPLVVDIINRPDDHHHQNQNQNQNQLGNEEQTSWNSSSPKYPFRAFSDLGGLGLRESSVNDGGDEGSVGGHIMRIPRSISMDHPRQTRVERFEDLH